MPFAAGRSSRLAPLAVAVALVATPVAAADFAGLVDIGGGRKMYLECWGEGSPTVVLVSGYGDTGRIWSVDAPELPRPHVLPLKK